MTVRTASSHICIVRAVAVILLAALTLTAWAPQAAAQGSDSVAVVAEYTLDTDGDGQFDFLAIDVQAEAAAAGDYYVYGWLYDQGFSVYIADCPMTFVHIETTAVVTLYCRGTDIYRSGTDGPYLLSVALYDATYALLALTYYTTQAYAASTFEVPPVAIVPPIEAAGVDTNGNGYFDVLRVDFSLDVQVEGLYLMNVWIHDGTGVYDDFNYGEAYLPVGITPESFDFSGSKISGLNVPGPYDIQITIQDADYVVMAQTSLQTWDGFDPSQFDVAPAVFTGLHTVGLLDTDGDGLANFITVDVEIQVNQGGDYYASAYAADQISGLALSGDGEEYILGPGLTTLHFELSTIPMAVRDLSGPYYIGAQLEKFIDNVNTVMIAMDAFGTLGYVPSEFDPAPAQLGTAVAGTAVDRDGDSISDVYRLGIEVDVQEAALFSIQGAVGGPIRWARAPAIYRYLEPGVQTVYVDIPGPALRALQISGMTTATVGLSVLAGSEYARYPEASYEVGPVDYSVFDAAAPAELTGTVTDAASGMPISDVYVRAMNYETEAIVSTWTDTFGQYDLPLYGGDWVLNLRDISYVYASRLGHVSLADATTVADFGLTPLVPDDRTNDLVLPSWDTVSQSRAWTFYSGVTTRQLDDWAYGDRDGWLSLAEFAVTRHAPGTLPAPVPETSDGSFAVDGQPYTLVPGSDSFAFSNVEGSMDDPSPIGATEIAAYANPAAPTADGSHVLSVNVQWDLPWYTWHYQIHLPAGFTAASVQAPEGVEVLGLGTGTVLLDPGTDPDPTDGLTSTWVTVTAASVPPSLSDLLVQPDPVDRGSSVTISIRAQLSATPAQVTIEIRDSRGRSLGTFPMAYDTESGRYEYSAAFRTRGTYTFQITLTDGLGRTATATGSFTVQKAAKRDAGLAEAIALL